MGESNTYQQRENAGYKIIKSIKIDGVEIVLGEDLDKQLSKYVTWLFIYNRYQLGHYFVDKDDALIDFYQRVYKECIRVAEDLKRKNKNG